jgi:hypothetical protein
MLLHRWFMLLLMLGDSSSLRLAGSSCYYLRGPLVRGVPFLVSKDYIDL